MNLFTPEYQRLLQKTHEGKWGTSGAVWVGEVARRTTLLGLHDPSILDYGCGQGRFAQAWRHINPLAIVQSYDPGRDEFSALPTPCDYVLCTDVLEHVEPSCMDDVLEHIHSLTNREALLHIACAPAKQILPDGRNAHISIHTPEDWMDKLARVWGIGHVGPMVKTNKMKTFLTVTMTK